MTDDGTSGVKGVKTLGPIIAVMGITLLSNVLGFGRESYIAYAFGASRFTDTYYVAAFIPTMLAGWIGFTVTNTLIPQLREELRKSKMSSKRLVASAFWTTCMTLVTMTAIVLIDRQVVVSGLAPGFTAAQHQEAVHLLIIMLGAIVLSGLCGVLAGVYEAENHFSYPMAMGVLNNLAFLCIAVGFRARFGISALAYGFLVGMSVNLILLWIPLRFKSRTMFSMRIRHPSLHILIRSTPPVLASYGIGIVNLIVDRILASGLPGGQITDLNFASKLGLLPGTLIGMSMATILYAQFVTFHLDRNIEALRFVVIRSIHWTIFFGMVVASGFVFFGHSLVSVLFAHGAFMASDVVLTSGAVHIYGLFSVFYLLPPILSRFFYARKENRFVFQSSLLAVSVNVLASVLLVHRLGIEGLVIANGLSQVTLVFTLLISTVSRIRCSMFTVLKDTFLYAVPPGGCFAFGVYALSRMWAEPPEHQVMLLLVRGILAFVFGTCMFGLYVRVAPQRMVNQFVGKFARWVGRSV